MKIFSWKGTAHYGNAQKIGEELENIEELGSIKPDDVVKYAESHKYSELYKCFEWDDKEASRKYRLIQANNIICSISLEIKEEPKKVQRVYVNIKDKETEERTFKNIRDILENDEEYQQLIDKAKSDLMRCKNQYEDLLQKEDLKDIIFEIYRNI